MILAELFAGETWEFARIAIRRSPRDRRSRKFLAELVGAAMLIPVVLAVVAGFLAAVRFAPELISGLAIALGIGMVSMLRLLRAQAQQQAALDEAAQAVPVEARARIFRTTFWLANLIWRNDSEIYIQTKQMPPGIEIITRRTVLDRLKARAIWDEMPEGVRDMLLKPDGHWDQPDVDRVESQFELLVCLRWVTHKDAHLRSMSLPPRYHSRQSLEIAEDDLWPGQQLTLAPEQLEPEEEDAEGYLKRCMIEAAARGLVEVDPEELAIALKEKNASDPKSDWIFGARSIGELTDTELRFVARRASYRWQALCALAEEMSTTAPDTGLRRLLEYEFRAPVTSE